MDVAYPVFCDGNGLTVDVAYPIFCDGKGLTTRHTWKLSLLIFCDSERTHHGEVVDQETQYT